MVAQSKPGGSPAISMILCVCCACTVLAVSPENAPSPISATKTPARTTDSPIKTRQLKNADCEVDFFFIVGFQLSFAFLCNASFNGDTETRQRVFSISCELRQRFGNNSVTLRHRTHNDRRF